jgi:hypothetical protein
MVMILDVCRTEERKIFYIYNETLRRIFKHTSNEITSCYKKVHNKEFHSSQSSAVTVGVYNEEELTVNYM